VPARRPRDVQPLAHAREKAGRHLVTRSDFGHRFCPDFFVQLLSTDGGARDHEVLREDLRRVMPGAERSDVIRLALESATRRRAYCWRRGALTRTVLTTLADVYNPRVLWRR